MNNKYWFLIIVLWNIIVFFTYGIDKRKAIRDKRRISEKTLLLFAFSLGGVGALFAMRFFRHKTNKRKFLFFVPLAIVMNAVLIFWFILL